MLGEISQFPARDRRLSVPASISLDGMKQYQVVLYIDRSTGEFEGILPDALLPVSSDTDEDELIPA